MTQVKVGFVERLLMTLFALSNLWMTRRHLLTTAGEVHL
ncbi:hypothetical protein PSEUDO8Z_80008 [Pseudomonas sp. 8Z]|nr:hypothetical protein PSEUDO8Z_80008 [Pseudomonas sp. 8Z]